jgi:serine phosphatase RsbU (regulator of sigma subunit)
MLEDSLRSIERHRRQAGESEVADAEAEQARASVEVVHGMEIDRVKQQEEASEINLVASAFGKSCKAPCPVSASFLIAHRFIIH